ncbi:copper amine oxidase N-terminal domain-containing protein [Brevibacillus sp. LEMMJ03]|uniref:stalk domain-containing protein n=1 Tax=Brevibacillus sp. LEMMJ03 TaxID=2595056 RepID=UPI00117F5FCF|nr:stalk domain-containing protein [Brevibacillus sp. LEMMJ03]TRY23300.1 copper amine oxidase N-terminal domain-containing protein [Brevibacillus sp. LEMMJ03]
MKKNRFAQYLLGTALLTTAVSPVTVLADSKDIQVKVDDVSVQFPDAKPYIDPSTSRTMIPIRFISEKLGASVEWDGAKQTVTMTKEGKQISFKIGEKKATVSGKQITFDAAATLQNNRTFVPLRFVSEAYGAKVDWLATERLVLITTNLSGGTGTSSTTPVAGQPGTNNPGVGNTTPTTGGTQVGAKVGAKGQFTVVAPVDPNFLLPKHSETEPAIDEFVASLIYEEGKLSGVIPKLPNGYLKGLIYTDKQNKNLTKDLTYLKEGQSFTIPVGTGTLGFVIYEGNLGKNEVYVRVPELEVEWGTKR